MADDPKNNMDAVPETNPRLPLILGLVVGLAIGGAAAAAYFVLKPETESVADTVEKVPPATPYYLDIDQMRAPLMDYQRAAVIGYVELEIQVEVSSEDEVDYIEMREPLLRHAANAILSKQGASTKDNPRQIDFDRVANDLTNAFNAALDKPVVKAVHIIKGTRI